MPLRLPLATAGRPPQPPPDRLRVVLVKAPPYAPPSMADVRAAEPNGHRIASTFAGAGGSSTGYRLAGFRVAWANEFVPAAAATYAANADPATVLDPRDIRDVEPSDITAAGPVAVLDGSPPCAPFSTQGNLSADWSRVVPYSDTAQRTDDLFLEYARLVEGVRPLVLVAENVSGLVRGVAKGYFKLILARLRACGYTVAARVLDAAWLGAPQERRRVIFIGVRDDLGVAPAFPSPLPYRRTIADALGDGCGGLVWRWGIADPTRPCPTIQTYYTSHSELAVIMPPGTDTDPETGRDLHAGGRGLRRSMHDRAAALAGAPERYRLDVRRPTLVELRALAGFPLDFELTGDYDTRWERIGRSVPPVMMAAIAATVRDRILAAVPA